MSDELIFSTPIRAGLVMMDAKSGNIQRIITLQFNPEQLTRTLQPQIVEADAGDRSEALRLKGPAIETIKLEAEIDIDTQSRFSGRGSFDIGIQPELRALETLVQPTSSQLTNTNRLASQGTLEVAPIEAPLTLFVWGQNRVLPVKVAEFSVTEESFDRVLNPIRAKVSLGLRVLTVSDLGFAHRGGSIYMAYLQRSEALAAKSTAGSLGDLGLGGLP